MMKKIFFVILILYLSNFLISCSSNIENSLNNPFKTGEIDNIKYSIQKINSNLNRYVLEGEEDVGLFSSCDNLKSKKILEGLAENVCIENYSTELDKNSINVSTKDGAFCSKQLLYFNCNLTQEQIIEQKIKKEKKIAKKLESTKKKYQDKVNALQELYFNDCYNERDKIEDSKTYLVYKKCLESLHEITTTKHSIIKTKINSLQENKPDNIDIACNGHQNQLNGFLNPEYVQCMELIYSSLKEEDEKLIVERKKKEEKEFILKMQVKYPLSKEFCDNAENVYRCYLGVKDKENRIAYLEERHSCILTYYLGDRYTTYFSCLNNKEVKNTKITNKQKKWSKNKNPSTLKNPNCDENPNSYICVLIKNNQKQANNLINLENSIKNETLDTQNENTKLLEQQLKNQERELKLKEAELAELKKQTNLEKQKLKEQKIKNDIERTRDGINMAICGLRIFNGGSIYDC